MPSRRLFEGPDIGKLLARIQSELGPGAQAVSAEKVRRGGVGGFFAREIYQVIVETEQAEPAEAVEATAGARPTRPMPVPVAMADPMVAIPSTEGTIFSELLRKLTDNTGAAESDAPALPAATVLRADDGSAAADDLVADDGEAAVTSAGPDGAWDSAEEWLSSASGDAGGATNGTAEGGAPTSSVSASPARLQAVPLPTAPRKSAGAGRTALTPARARTSLRKMGLPASLMPAEGRLGLVPALYRSLSRLPVPPPVNLQPGEVMAVVGSADMALTLASRVALALGLGPDEVAVACANGSGGGTAGGERVLITSAASAEAQADRWAELSRPTVVSIASEPGSGREAWAGRVIEALQPAMVWGVVEATRKPEDVYAWTDAVGQVDALALEDMDATTSPAAILGTGIPIVLIDGQMATAEAWTALLTSRLRAAA